MIIPFGSWHHEHTIKNIETPEKCCFDHRKFFKDVQDEGIADMWEWDKTLAFAEEARMIGRIGSTRQEVVQLEGLLKPYWQYKELFENEKAEMVALRQTFDDAIDLKDRATPPWQPIYPISAYQLGELNKYLHNILAEGKIVHRKSRAGTPILFVPKPHGRVRLCLDYSQLNTLTIHNKYPLPLMTELRGKVAGATIFTKLDLKDGYHPI